MILFASDLDNTMIHSYKKANENEICVEYANDGKKLSYMTPFSYNALAEINKFENLCFVPLTTRSVEQYQRIRLFSDSYPHYAIASNGGNLLIDNVIDDEWHSESLSLIENSIPELEKSKKLLLKDKNIQFEPIFVDELFMYTKSDTPEETALMLKENLDLEVVSVFTNGQKVYALPKNLSKGNAVNRFNEKFGFELTISAGDSGFDIPMLECTDISFCFSKELADRLVYAKNKLIKPSDTNYAEYICEQVRSICFLNDSNKK